MSDSFFYFLVGVLIGVSLMLTLFHFFWKDFVSFDHRIGG